jgi:hypothetical protein
VAQLGLAEVAAVEAAGFKFLAFDIDTGEVLIDDL